MNAIIEAGYPYELAGLVFYLFFLYMVRKRKGVIYSQRTRTLTIMTAIGLVGVVPFHYAANVAAIATIMLIGLAALFSAFRDARPSR
jgi:hypothetical protein